MFCQSSNFPCEFSSEERKRGSRRGEGNASENCSKWEQFVAGLMLQDLQCSPTGGSNGFLTFVIIIYIYIYTDCLLILCN